MRSVFFLQTEEITLNHSQRLSFNALIFKNLQNHKTNQLLFVKEEKEMSILGQEHVEIFNRFELVVEEVLEQLVKLLLLLLIDSRMM